MHTVAFPYNESEHAWVRNNFVWSWVSAKKNPWFPATIDGRFGDSQKDFPGTITDFLFYAFLAARSTDRNINLSVDFQLLLANAVIANTSTKDKIFCAQWDFLPASILLASRGYTVNLPEIEGEAEETRNFINFMNGFLPARPFGLGNYAPADFALASIPWLKEQLFEKGASSIRALAGGKLASLEIPSEMDLRSRLVGADLVRSILEIPHTFIDRTYFPQSFLMRLDSSQKDEKVHFGRLAAAKKEGERLNLPLALRRLVENEESEDEMTVDVSVISHNRNCGLSFTSIAVGRDLKIAGRQIVLGDLAHILRCQIARKKLTESECEDLAKFAPNGKLAGSAINGTFICREVNQMDLDPQSGILLPGKGALVALSNESDFGKYVLNAGDTLFAFRGTENGVGACGYVQETKIPAITSRYICIVRPKKRVSAVWLYYMLRSDPIRESIRGLLTGESQKSINIETLRLLPFELPDSVEVDKMESYHAHIVACQERVTNLYRRMAKYQKIMKVGSGKGFSRDLAVYADCKSGMEN